MPKETPFAERYIEDKLSQIGAKVAKATEMSHSAQELCKNSSKMLVDAQAEIADLYETLEDVLTPPSTLRKTVKLHKVTGPASD